MRVGKAINLVRFVAMGPTWLALVPFFAAAAFVLLSIVRLVAIATHVHGSSGTGATNGNLKPALGWFYDLVLAQVVLFLLWFLVAVDRSRLAADLDQKYLRHLRFRSHTTQIVKRYVGSIADTCIQKGVSSTINTTLVSFAAELLLQSEDPDDHVSAVLVLYSLVIKNEERSHREVEQICSSDKLVYKLVRMLPSEDLDADIKEYIAQIVTELACKLRLADIPGAAHCISSLLDSRFIMMKNAVQTGPNPQPLGVNQRTVDIDSRGEIKPLFVHGLVILRKFAVDPVNCTEIYNTMDLVPKIIAPVSSGLHMVIKNDETTVEIVRESLRVLAKLTRGTGEGSRKLCHELTTKYGRTADNILWILSNSDDQDMTMQAVEILSWLTLDEPRMLQFTVELRRLLLHPQDSQLRIEAGKALIARGDEFPDIQQLVTIMTYACSKEYRAVIAEILAQICAKSTADQDTINRLSSVANALSTVLEAIATETTNITELDMSNSKFLASFLGLAVQIREKLVTAEAFADAVTGLPMANNLIFAETLKRIIEMTNHSLSDDEARLAIMKSATKLVTWMMEIDTISPGYYIEYFRQENIVQRLEDARWAMVHLERYVVMTGGADEKEGYVTLQTLVETAKNKLVPQQQPPPLPPPQQQS